MLAGTGEQFKAGGKIEKVKYGAITEGNLYEAAKAMRMIFNRLNRTVTLKMQT